jgi:hypothetical protein
MVVHLLWIINQSGQQIYKHVFTAKENIGELGRNPDLHITLPSVFFGLCSMTREISPNQRPLDASGMNLVEGTEHNIHVFETPTTLKFVLVTDPGTTSCDTLFQDLYVAYVDFVLKNPFHSVDEGGIGLSIRIPAFTEAVKGMVEKANDPPPPKR